MDDSPSNLRVVVGAAPDALSPTAAFARRLGWSPAACEDDPRLLAHAAERVAPYAAFVGLAGASVSVPLALTTELVRTGVCPVVVLSDAADRPGVSELAHRGAHGIVVQSDDPARARTTIEIARLRFEETARLRDTFERRVVIEQAKGILMGRDGIEAEQAFDLLRAHARRSATKLHAVAQAILDSHLLFEPRELTDR